MEGLLLVCILLIIIGVVNIRNDIERIGNKIDELLKQNKNPKD